MSPENQISYTRIIDGILATSDLDQVTVKKIRSGLELAVGQDLTEHKAAIKELIGERFDKFNAERAIKQAAKAEPKPVANGTNGSHKRPASPSESASISATPSSPALSEPISDIPPKKKVKRAGADDADAALAARLQAEENGRARPTRGGGITKKRGQTVKKSPMKKKKKSANRIKADDDSALSGESGDDAEPTKRGGAFNKPWDLSYPLAALTGEPRVCIVLTILSCRQLLL